MGRHDDAEDGTGDSGETAADNADCGPGYVRKISGKFLEFLKK